MVNQAPKRLKYEGLTLLGSSDANISKSPQEARLETFPNPEPSRNYRVRILGAYLLPPVLLG